MLSLYVKHVSAVTVFVSRVFESIITILRKLLILYYVVLSYLVLYCSDSEYY